MNFLFNKFAKNSHIERTTKKNKRLRFCKLRRTDKYAGTDIFDERINSVWNSDECINSLLTSLYKMRTLRINNASRASRHTLYSHASTRVRVRVCASAPVGHQLPYEGP